MDETFKSPVQYSTECVLLCNVAHVTHWWYILNELFKWTIHLTIFEIPIMNFGVSGESICNMCADLHNEVSCYRNISSRVNINQCEEKLREFPWQVKGIKWELQIWDTYFFHTTPALPLMNINTHFSTHWPLGETANLFICMVNLSHLGI